MVNPLARAEVRAWTRTHIAHWGRVCAYRHIAAELDQRNWDPSLVPPYLTVCGLKRSERRNIAVFRIQCASYVATHAGAYDTDLYGPKQRYFRRYCVWKECCDAAALDDARHVLLHCPLHDIDRAVMLRSVRTALHNVRLTLEDIGSETAVVQLLLGSVPVTAAHALSAHQTTHRDILRASSKYLKYVYDTRWKYGHNFKQ